MPNPIYLNDSPMAQMGQNLLYNMVLQKIAHNMQMDRREQDIKREDAKTKRLEAREKARQNALLKFNAQMGGQKVVESEAEKVDPKLIQSPYSSTTFIEPAGGIELKPIDGVPGMYAKVQGGKIVDVIKGHPPTKQGAIKTFTTDKGVYALERDENSLNGYKATFLGKSPNKGIKFRSGDVEFTSGSLDAPSTFQPTDATQTKIQKDIIQLDDTISSLGGAINAFKPEYLNVGYIFDQKLSGWKEKFKGVPVMGQIMGDVTPQERQALQDFADFRNKMANTVLPKIREAAGANFTKMEKKLYFQQYPNAGEGVLDGDAPSVFMTKLKNMQEALMYERARRIYYENQKIGPEKYRSLVSSGKVKSIEETKEMIAQKGDELEQELRLKYPQMSDAQIQAKVLAVLKNTYRLFQ